VKKGDGLSRPSFFVSRNAPLCGCNQNSRAKAAGKIRQPFLVLSMENVQICAQPGMDWPEKPENANIKNFNLSPIWV
jgi:hypothetical protein